MKKHKTDKYAKVSKVKKCNICEETFSENCDLENNLKTHESETFGCEKCDKPFVLKWILRKQMHVHETDKFFHYFNNDKFCPFEEICCKFKHELSSACKFKICNNILCQYRHKDINSPEEFVVTKAAEDKSDDDQKCNKECYTAECLTNHIKCVHDSEKEYEEYSQFLREKQKNMKSMNPTELFEMQKRDPSKKNTQEI